MASLAGALLLIGVEGWSTLVAERGRKSAFELLATLATRSRRVLRDVVDAALQKAYGADTHAMLESRRVVVLTPAGRPLTDRVVISYDAR